MLRRSKSYVRNLIRKSGVDIVRHKEIIPGDMDEFTRNVFETVKTYTMTNPERIMSVVEAIRYVEKNKIPGAIVECGVWRGGCVMAMAMTLLEHNNSQRDIYLYDTFAGMTAPTDIDVSITGDLAQKKFNQVKTNEDRSDWCLASLEDVQQNVFGTGYPSEQLHFFVGKVEETIPKEIPQQIAVLRLDTDWYESTKHELVHLYPLLAPNGILIIDDYGYWQGARQAVDEYIAENNLCLYLARIDGAARVAIKPA